MNPTGTEVVQFWSLINSVLSFAVLLYAVRTENRITKLETMVSVLVKAIGLRAGINIEDHHSEKGRRHE